MKQLLVILVFISATLVVHAQEAITGAADNENEKKQRTSILEKFDPDFDLMSTNERKRIRLEHHNEIALRKSILDTLDIPERKRERLVRELNKNPFSDRLNRRFAEIQFEDED